MAKVTVDIYLDKRRKTKTGGHRVRIRVTFKRKTKYYDTGIILEEDDFLRIKNAKRRTDSEKETKWKLDALLHRAIVITEKLPIFTFQQFEKKYYTNKEATNTISSGFNEYIEQLNQEKRFGTAESYQTAKNSIEAFSANSTYADIDARFLQNYENWMLEQNKSITTVGFYLRALRTIFNNAISAEHISPSLYPFGKTKYVIPTSKNNKRALPIEEIKQIFEYPAVPYSDEDFGKDMWIFIYLTSGINFVDLCRLKWSQINGNILTYNRTKTKRTKRVIEPIQVPLKGKTWEIIKKWGNRSKAPSDFLFPFFLGVEKDTKNERERKKDLNKKINSGLKSIGNSLNLSIPLTTYVARHSYATIMVKNGIQLTTLKSQLGHSTINTTEKYIGSLGIKNLIEITDKLTQF